MATFHMSPGDIGDIVQYPLTTSNVARRHLKMSSETTWRLRKCRRAALILHTVWECEWHCKPATTKSDGQNPEYVSQANASACN